MCPFDGLFKCTFTIVRRFRSIRHAIRLSNMRRVSKQQDSTAINDVRSSSATILGCLWDVTDRDIDGLTFFLLEQLKAGASLGDALRYGRDLCKLKCLNGAAPVIYGLPVRAR
jgi:hypothetical protein